MFLWKRRRERTVGAESKHFLLTMASAEEIENVLDACRYGDLDDVHAFLSAHGPAALAGARDERGNTPLHMAAANGHVAVLDALLPHLAPDARNGAGSTPLHWAALNAQLGAVQRLVAAGGVALIDARSAAGRTPLAEAELAGWDEGARWLVDRMDLEEAPPALDTDEPVPQEDEGAEEPSGPVQGADAGPDKTAT